MLTSLKQVKKGFTIIELLIVIAIIVILAGLVLTNVNGAQAKARDATRLQDIGSITRALELYHQDNSAYPQTFTAATLGNVEEDALLDERGGDSIEILAAVADRAAAQAAVAAAADDDTVGTAAYVYAAYPTGCTNDCTGWVLGTYLEQGDNNYSEELSLNN